MSSLLGVPRNTVSQMVQDGVVTTKEGVNKLKAGEVEGTAFFESASQPLPDAKFVSKKTGKSESILTRPLKELYSDFQAQAEHRISISHFAKLRPIPIRLMSTTNLRQYLCEYCTNVQLKLRAVNAIAAKLKNERRIHHIYHAVDITGYGIIAEHTMCVMNAAQTSLISMSSHCCNIPITWLKWESCVAEAKRKKVCVSLTGLTE